MRFVVTLLAAGALGASVQMLHMPYRRAELAALIGHGRPKAFVGLSAFKEETPVATVEAFGMVDIVLAIDVLMAKADSTSIATTEAAVGATAGVAVDPDARYLLLHTSGTTAEPKGVPVTHRQFLGNARSALAPLQIRTDDVLLAAAPFTHLYGLFVLEMAILQGACVSLLPAFTPADFIARLRADRVSAVFAGPAHVRPLLADPGSARASMRDLRLVCLSGTAVPPALAAEVESLLAHGKVIQLWGMTELQAGTYGRPDDQVALRHHTAGRPGPGTELRIRAIEGDAARVPAGVEGALQMRGPSLFDGYLDNEDATRAAFDDGWFETGDLALLSDEGALVLTGRIKEVINRGGVKFNPIEIEALIDQMPGVGCSAIVPMPDPVLGERACVFIEPAPAGRAPSLSAIVAMLDEAGIARYKWPERLEIVEAMPMTPTRKVMRGRLAARLAG